MIRHYLHQVPAKNLSALLDQFAEAAWMEQRQMEVMAAALAKALGGGK